MENLIKIEIKNSFNRKDDSQKVIEGVVDNGSTLNHYDNITEVSSISVGSITANQFHDDFKIITKKDKKGFLREVLICAIGGAVGAIVSAIMTYFIFGIK
jgi:hypothetical protein